MKAKLIKAASLGFLAISLTSFQLVPSGDGRDLASCNGPTANAPVFPFGTDLYAQVNAEAYKENFSYWYNYLSQVEQKATASRLAIRQSYGLDLPASSYTGVAQAAGLAPANVIASSPAFRSFTPLASFATMGSMNLPQFQRSGFPQNGFGI
jgi:hypothetical protein